MNDSSQKPKPNPKPKLRPEFNQATQPAAPFQPQAASKQISVPSPDQSIEPKDAKNADAAWIERMKKAFEAAARVQEGAKHLIKELEGMEFLGESANGLVTISLDGNQKPLQVVISSDIVSQHLDAERMSNLLLAALKDAHQKSTRLMRERMNELTDEVRELAISDFPVED